MSKVALVTGGQRGIGLAISRTLVDAGYKVALLAQCDPGDHEVGTALEQLGPDTAFFSHDLLNVDDHGRIVSEVETGLGPITTFVSNAGVPAKVRGDMLEITKDSFDVVMGVNLKGAFFLAQEIARRMLNRPSDCYRSMSFVTSVSAEMVSSERAEYCVSKAGASMMAQLFAVRMAPHDIGVFEIRPGVIETALTAGVKDTYTARIKDGLVPSARWGYPADIASTILPLAEGRMAVATGSVINVDGGLSIPRL